MTDEKPTPDDAPTIAAVPGSLLHAFSRARSLPELTELVYTSTAAADDAYCKSLKDRFTEGGIKDWQAEFRLCIERGWTSSFAYLVERAHRDDLTVKDRIRIERLIREAQRSLRYALSRYKTLETSLNHRML
jgi:hypothetical protein